MSKSYDNAIDLKEEPEIINKKVAGMITDPQRKTKTDPGRPDYCNVATFYRIFCPELYEELEVATKCSGAGWGCVECKKNTYGGLAEYLKPIQEKRQELAETSETIEEILQAGAAKASELANQTLEKARELCKLTGKRVP